MSQDPATKRRPITVLKKIFFAFVFLPADSPPGTIIKNPAYANIIVAMGRDKITKIKLTVLFTRDIKSFHPHSTNFPSAPICPQSGETRGPWARTNDGANIIEITRTRTIIFLFFFNIFARSNKLSGKKKV